ncbi:MAG: glycogen/starch/alpha-glucan phosphorylase [Deltaproteobacteria bacterium]|nr:glycogen/starch/alpha-glucan phosphorylase [Deltaproteobacteria bacterium]
MKDNKKTEEVERLKSTVMGHIEHDVGRDPVYAGTFDHYLGLSYALRDKLMEKWVKTQRSYYKNDAKRVYYLSLEFLIGRTLGNTMVNLGVEDECTKVMESLGHRMESVREAEWDAGLGNGGLGRLAACFLDSMATLGVPSYGYGIRYEYGIFYQRIKNGCQIESPDNWLRYGSPWEIIRPNHLFPVQFSGRVNQYTDSNGVWRNEWVDTEEVMAMACDTPIPGYRNDNVINMRLWVAKATRAFDLSFFNSGNYIQAVEEKEKSECISKVLYPADHIMEGRLLRLKQQYFFVSATFQDIMRRYEKDGAPFDNLPKKVAVQLNDTHPAIAIPEFMRILLDLEGVPWEKAWEISVATFAYTNHTVMPEALEKWPVSMFESLLPRHLQIIYEINRRFLDDVWKRFSGDFEKIRNMSLIEEGHEKMIRMANLAIVGSHSINGVSALHTKILKDQLFRDFYEMYPERFNNKTNGITQRRWLKKANPNLSNFISEKIGEGWITNLDELKKLAPLTRDKNFRKRWMEVKRENKKRLAAYIQSRNNIAVDVDSMFDVQIKRLHEYKRQLLNVLHIITMYNRILCGKGADIAPRTVIFAGKAAPAYWMAKLIIKLTHSVADVVNNNKEVGNKLKVVFLSNYNVSLAEKIIPAADLSEQISTAGTEASGTGNMKLSLNGALTIGTLDGANVEIMEEVGKENIFIFGHTADENIKIKGSGYNPYDYYEKNHELKTVLDMIGGGYFSPEHKDLFKPIVDSLLYQDTYMLLADYESYISCQEEVGKLYKDRDKWAKKSILNVANMGKFSSDRTIREYAKEIWGIEV